MKKLLMCLLIMVSTLFSCKAEQLLGVNVSYHSIRPSVYVVTYTVYTDNYFEGKLDTSIFKPLEFKVISGSARVVNSPKLLIKDSLNVGCRSNYKWNTVYLYQDTVDLNQSKYASIKSSGNCRTYFSCSYPLRYKNIKNIRHAPYFTYAFVNTCNNSANTSVKSNDPFIRNFCCNQPFFNNGAFSDAVDYDSLSYHFTSALADLNIPTSFKTGYSIYEQMDGYWPAGYDKSKGANPVVNPPIGVYLDSFSGEIIFTPTLCNANYSVAYEVTEFKKNGSKSMEVGGLLYDFVYRSTECPDNNPPILYGPYNYTADVGTQICFDVISDDKQFIPPPPQKPQEPDTVRITWNREVPGATFTILNPNARLASAKFCWTPKLSDYRSLPYTFNVTASDNACVFSLKTTKKYSIQVRDPNGINKIKSNKEIQISPNPSSNGILKLNCQNLFLTEVAIIDMTGKQLKCWNFKPSQQFEEDLSAFSSGVYLIKCTNGKDVFNMKWIKQ